eukprot:1874213-Pyramimonas_sp.AAC.1
MMSDGDESLVAALAHSHLYTRSGHQSRKGKENIPVAGTNHGRGERIYPQRAPITEGELSSWAPPHLSLKSRMAQLTLDQYWVDNSGA